MPGKSSSSLINLARLFDLSEMGTYRLTVRKKIYTVTRPPAQTVVLEIKDIPLVVRDPNEEDWANWR